MDKYVAEQTVKNLTKTDSLTQEVHINGRRLTLKEYCPDLHTSPVVSLIHEIKPYNIRIVVRDKVATHTKTQNEFRLIQPPQEALLITDAHMVAIADKKCLQRNLAQPTYAIAPYRSFNGIKYQLNPQALEQSALAVEHLL